MPYLLAAAFGVLGMFAAQPTNAATGVVNASGVGHDSQDAIGNLLRNTVTKYFREQPQLTRVILQTEILPNASSFVQSYKINEGSKSGAVNLSASVDLDVINGLLSLTPKNIGDEEGAKALVLARGAKLPDSVLSSLKPGSTPPDPFKTLAEAGRERFFRRQFTEATLTAEEMQSTGAGEDLTSPELLRGLGAKAGARVVLAISGRYETYDNENSHNKEERMVLSAVMVDVKMGTVIGRASVNVVNPKTRREQYVADLQRSVLEESKDLFQDVFVAAGRKLVKGETHDEFSVVRVLYPPNAALVMRFKALLEGVPGVRSVVEYSVRRGKFDLALRPAMSSAALGKAIANLLANDISVTPLETVAAGELEARPPVISVKLLPKEAAVPAEGGPNANPASHH